MEALSSSSALWLLASIQLAGLGAAFVARLSENSSFQSWCHALFMVALILAGVATAASLALGPGVALIGGASLAVISVAAVCEVRPAPNLETF